MLLEWKIGNFKSIAELTTLKMAPLTILVGANSSGKSTILQSILAVMQTLASPTSERPFILNGEFLKLGSVTDILHQGRKEEMVEFRFDLQLNRESLPLVLSSLEQPVGQISEPEIRAHVFVRCLPGPMSAGEASRLVLGSTAIELGNATIRMERNPQASSLILGARLADGDGFRISKLSYPLGGDRPIASEDKLRVKVNHFLPEVLLEPFDIVSEQLSDALSLCEEYLPRNQVYSWVITKLSDLSFDSPRARSSVPASAMC